MICNRYDWRLHEVARGPLRAGQYPSSQISCCQPSVSRSSAPYLVEQVSLYQMNGEYQALLLLPFYEATFQHIDLLAFTITESFISVRFAFAVGLCLISLLAPRDAFTSL